MSGFISLIEETRLIERLTGVLIYAIVVAIAYLALKRTSGSQGINFIFNSTLLVLCIMAFFFVPNESKDLYKWLVIAQDWKYMSFEYFSKHILLDSATPIAYLFIYLTTKTGITGFLPCVCAFVFFCNVFHIFKDTYKRFSPNNIPFSLSFLFFMSAGSFLEVISGVRCFVALSIVVRCIYDEIVAEKGILGRIPLYACACLIHSAAIPVFAFRLIFYMFVENKKTIRQIIMRATIVFGISVVAIVFANQLIDNMFLKLYVYLFEERYSYFWEYLIGFVQWCTMVYMLHLLNHEISSENSNLYSLQRFLKAFLWINLFLIIEYNLFHRFLVVSSILFVPYFASFQYKPDSSKSVAVCQRLFLLSTLIFVIACTRGNLCGYKFFLL